MRQATQILPTKVNDVDHALSIAGMQAAALGIHGADLTTLRFERRPGEGDSVIQVATAEKKIEVTE